MTMTTSVRSEDVLICHNVIISDRHNRGGHGHKTAPTVTLCSGLRMKHRHAQSSMQN
jgi:hypothetical protein